VWHRLRRQKRGVQPTEPATLHEIDLPDHFKMTGKADPNRFLIHDSGPTEQKRMLVFASKEQLRHLAASDIMTITSKQTVVCSSCSTSRVIVDQQLCLVVDMHEELLRSSLCSVQTKNQLHILHCVSDEVIHQVRQTTTVFR